LREQAPTLLSIAVFGVSGGKVQTLRFLINSLDKWKMGNYQDLV